jgi:hypothetical protein
MSPRTIAIATAVAALGSTGVATAADAPVVSAQKSSVAKTAPLTIAGTGIKKGARLPKGARIVYRDVTLEGTQKVLLTIKAPKGKTLRGLMPTEGSHVGFVVVKPARYSGKRSVQVRAFGDNKVDGEVTGRIYALVR